MSLAGLMTALVEYVDDRLLNDVGVQTERRLSYHGDKLPADCCTEGGTLALLWAEGRTGDSFPATSASARVDPCAKLHMVTFDLRYLRCTPNVEVTPQGVTVNEYYDSLWNAYGLLLADVGDGVARALTALQCLAATPHRPTDPSLDTLEVAVLSNLARLGSLRLRDWSPIVPDGGCAGVRWRVDVAATPQAAS